jgi:serine/threonine protein kinase
MSRAPSPSDDTALSRVLAGRYRLIRLVGHGGMGSVYEATHVHTEKRVAVKLLSPQLSKDLKLVARFRREAMAASRLEHENCVHVDDFGEDNDGTFYIAMELIDGHGLADELRKSGPMPPDRVARIAVQLLKALDAAHSAGVLHRDLKPQNVMLTQKPQKADLVKVVDFGIAKLTTNTPEEQAALTVPGTIFGTPEYMSPEQARGETLDVRSDLYSAAVVLWHMMLGRSPFRGTSVRETLMKVFADEPPLPSRERPGVQIPAGFEQVLLKAMAKKKEDRYPDAASFLEALRPYVGGVHPEVPRRPLQGIPKDGSPPPATLDDARSVTQAIPESELPPLAASASAVRPDAVTAPSRPAPRAADGNPPTPATPHPQGGATPADATRFGAVATPGGGLQLPPPKLDPHGAMGKTKVLPLDAVKTLPQGMSAAPLPASASGPGIGTSSGLKSERVTEPMVLPRRRKKLSTAALVVVIISAIGAALLAAAVVTVLYLVSEGAFDKKEPPKVVEVGQKDVLTDHDHKIEKDKLDKELTEVPVDPIARDAALDRADAALKAGDIAGARIAYEDAVTADPAAPKALIGLGTTALQQKDYAASVTAFEKAMALDADYARKLAAMHARAKKLRDESK